MFTTKESVEQYYQMFAGYNNEYVISEFNKYVPKDYRILELGMGTGADYLALKPNYQITSSDYSQAFIDKFHERCDDQVLNINALTMEGVVDQYDCIYSNKVLQVLEYEQIEQSIARQVACLSSNGMLVHSLWSYQSNDIFGITKEQVRNLFAVHFQQIIIISYDEIGDGDDSLLIIASELQASK